MRSLLEYDPLGTNAHPALDGGSVLLCYLGQVCSLSCSNLCLNWNLLNLQSFFSISARGVLKPPIIIMDFSISPFPSSQFLLSIF